MKKIIFVFLVFLVFPLVLFAQERITLNGNIFDGVAFFPIVGANIYNFNTKKFSFTDSKGNFEILANKGDTIIISKSSYKQLLIEITPIIFQKKTINIALYYKAIILKEVVVYALPKTYEEFKRDFVNVEFSEINKKITGTTLTEQDRINEEFKSREGPNLLRNIPAVASPITALYDRFSRKKKIERLYQEIVNNEEEIDKLPLKYNRELVTSITGLEGEELLNFMTFCKFSYYDLVKWSPEFIISQIKKKYVDYEYYKAIEKE